MSALPKISIITPSFNQGQYLEQTILSIIQQGYENLEFIIIDGGSTDTTVDVIKKYEDKIAYWVSEPDRGQAHAINKGLAVATGEIFNWVNSDDYLLPGSFHEIGKFFNENPHKEVYCGYTRCFYDKDNSTSHTYRMGVKETVADTILNVEMNQPGSFYRTNVVKELGGVNESLRYVFDDELWFRYLCSRGLNNIGFSENTFAEFRLHGSSKSVGEGFDLFNIEIQTLYTDIAMAAGLAVWLTDKMKAEALAPKYITSKRWDVAQLEANRFAGYFANKYLHYFYAHGEKENAREAMKMSRDNGYFKWNRMMLSLFIKLQLQ